VAAELGAGEHAARDAIEPRDGGDVRLDGAEELGFLGRDAKRLILHLGEDGGAAAAAVGPLPLGPEVLDGLVAHALVRVEVAAWDAGVAEEPGAVLLGGDAEADALAGVGDRGQALQLAGPGVGADVEQVGAV
jgi:hypothetical protein